MDKKKAAAAVSGVFAYIRQEEAVAAEKAAPCPIPANTWGLSGRQDAMSMRTLMQLRALRSSGGFLR